MYLEISPRQSGKTTRLVKSVVDDLVSTEKHKVIIMCFSGLRKHIQELISGEIFSRTLSRSGRLSINNDFIICTSWEQFIETNAAHRHAKRYFDDFDFLPLPCDFDLRSTDYLCTTPQTIRTIMGTETIANIRHDLLLRAFFLNDAQVVSFPRLNVTPDLYDLKLKPDIFQREVLGVFVNYKPAPAKTQQVLILNQSGLPPQCSGLIESSDIVVTITNNGDYFKVDKNRFGWSGEHVPVGLLKEFLQAPEGRLVTSIKWVK